MAFSRIPAVFLRTMSSSEQEAASTLALTLEPVSRCLLSLTQAFGSLDRSTCLDAPPFVAPLRLTARASLSVLISQEHSVAVILIAAMILWPRASQTLRHPNSKPFDIPVATWSLNSGTSVSGLVTYDATHLRRPSSGFHSTPLRRTIASTEQEAAHTSVLTP